MLETAISLTPFDNINPHILKKFDRVYIGSNFCSNLIPTIKDIKRLKDNGIKKITITIPLLSDLDLKKVLNLIKKSLQIIDYIEVSANDIGFIDILKKEHRIKILLARPISHDWMRMDTIMLIKFIKRFNIKYIETDESQMLEKFMYSKINFSFHYPMEYLSMTRICPFEKKLNNLCKRKCMNKNIVKLNETGTENIIYLKNNAYFKRNMPVKFKNIKRNVLLYYGQKI